MPSMCVRGLGHWLVGEVRRVEKQIWLGMSLGAFAASVAALLCETALAQPRALVALDSRDQYPVRPREVKANGHEQFIY